MRGKYDVTLYYCNGAFPIPLLDGHTYNLSHAYLSHTPHCKAPYISGLIYWPTHCATLTWDKLCYMYYYCSATWPIAWLAMFDCMWQTEVSSEPEADHERCSCAIARQVLCLSVGLDHASCLESVSISSHSVALNKATDVGRFTVWGVAQIGVA